MKTNYRILIIPFAIFLTALLNPIFSIGQSNPLALKPAIQIERLLTVQNGVVRMVHDQVTGRLLYSNTSGNIYTIIQPQGGAAYDSLIYTVTDHSVQYVQGMAIFDSTLYVSGNINSSTPLTQGIIARGKIQSNGSRLWDTLMLTEAYETGDYFDHLFSGLTVSPSGDSIYICSGARGDHGEVQDRYGLYPNLRNTPLTTNLYSLPTRDVAPILLRNDSIWNDTSAYLFARGIRNTFSMAFDASGNLFGVENSGDRDHNEEMNWLRRGKHYGFPWKMGDTYNPQQYPGFNPATDLLIPHYSRSWRIGAWNNDPSFPQVPSGLVFEDPIQNHGPDADKFRDTITGEVKDASDLAMTMGTFTAHRSPLGLIFDNDQVLHSAYRGDAFMLSWTKGLDSCGCTSVPDTGIGPFVDPSQDLLHLDLAFDSTIGNFQLSATRIVSEFSRPIDAVIDSNVIFVIENGYGNTSGLYKITLPVEQACQGSLAVNYADSCSKAPVSLVSSPAGSAPFDVEWHDNFGIILQMNDSIYGTATFMNAIQGSYYVIVTDSALCRDSISFSVRPELRLEIYSVTGTNCIGCNDGVVKFDVLGSTSPETFTVTPNFGNFSGDSLLGLPAGTYLICVEDNDGCTDCDTVVVLEDPSSVFSSTFISGKMLVYPNPASETVHVRIGNTNGQDIKIRILDPMGKEQVSRILETSTNTEFSDIRLSLENIAPGNYIIEVNLNGNLKREVFNIQK